MRANHQKAWAHTWAGAGACGPSAKAAPGPQKFTALWVRPWATLHAGIFPHGGAGGAVRLPDGLPRPWYAAGGPRSIRRSRQYPVSSWRRSWPPPAGRQPLGIPACTGGPLRGAQLGPSWPAEALGRSRWPPVYPGVCRQSRRVPGGASGLSCGVVSPEIPARAGGPLRGAQSGPCYPAEALVCSQWPPAYARGMPAPRRCPASAWRRSWPLLWGGSP